MTADRPDLSKPAVVKPAPFADTDPADVADPTHRSTVPEPTRPHHPAATDADPLLNAIALSMRGERSGDAQWSRTRTFRFRPEEDATLTAAAASTGETMTDLLRHAILTTYKKYRPR